MSSAFANTHNMVAILTKSDASEGFGQILDFLNRSYIKYAMTVNPHIYVSCIKQFWNTVTVKQSTDVTRLQALVDKKKVVISEAVIRDILLLEDAEGVDCLPNEEIFIGLARMWYEKPSTKLTFYRAFFSSQWKFLIYTILHSLSAKRTSWNKFNSAMASAVIFLSTGRKYNFSKYILHSLVRNVDSSFKFYMYPRFVQLIIHNQLDDLSTHTTKYTSPALTQKVFANMRRVGKGSSGVATPLFEEDVTTAVEEDIQAPSIPSPSPPPQDLPSTSQMQHTPPSSSQPQPQAQTQAVDFPLGLLQIALDTCVALTSKIEQLESDKLSQALEITRLKKQVKRLENGHKVRVFKLRRLKKVGISQRVKTSDDTIIEDVYNQRRMIVELDKDEGIELMGEKEKTKQSKDIAHDVQGEGRHERQAEIYQIDMDHAAKVLSMQEDETRVHEVVDVVTTAKMITEVVAAVSETITAASANIAAIPAATITASPIIVAMAYTRMRKGVVIRDPEEESTIKTPAKTPAKTKSKDKGKSIMVEEPKPMKKKDHVELDEEYARKLHKELNKDIDWDTAIEHMKQKAKEDKTVQRYQVMKKRPQAEAHARKNMMIYLKNTDGFRLDYFKGLSYDDIRPIFEATQKAAKRRKLNKEAKDDEDLKQHMEIVPDEDDDVYTEATPLARKVLVVDYQIIQVNNKPRYKIIKADGTHQLYASFITLLKNFDRDDLESLWSIVKERLSTSKPNNYSDDYLLTTLRAMFGRPDGQDYAWKSQRSNIPTFEVYTGTNAKCSKTLSGRAEWDVFGTFEVHKTTTSRKPARVMVEHILHDAKEQEWNQATLELMLLWSLKKNTKCFNAAGEEVSAAKHKLMMLVYCC
nr:hypothetical protein [Tanacetum cinerariifolium]